MDLTHNVLNYGATIELSITTPWLILLDEVNQVFIVPPQTSS